LTVTNREQRMQPRPISPTCSDGKTGTAGAFPPGNRPPWRGLGRLGMLGMMGMLGMLGMPGVLGTAQAADLHTPTEHSLGVSLSGYEYQEPGFMSLHASKIGIDYAGTYAISRPWPQDRQGWFLGGHARYATGKADYRSPVSGTLDNRENWYYEVRGWLGKDVMRDTYVLSPYTGLGWRYLYNDLRGTTSTGNLGYRRESRYTSVLLGVTHRMHLSDQSLLKTTVEYLHLLEGEQRANLADVTPLLPDLRLPQDNGYGLRLSTTRQLETWQVGLNVGYWNIAASQAVSGRVEPRNSTLEVGIQVAFPF
jgi:hypothetical protein